MMKSLLSPVCAILLSLLSINSLLAGQRGFKELGLSLNIPEDFKDLPPEMVPDMSSAAFIKGDPHDELPDFAISVQPLGGLIGKGQRLRMEDLPKEAAGQGFSVGSMTWSGHTVDTVEVKVTGPTGAQVLSIGVQLPLQPQAVQLNFAGPAAEEAAVRQTAKDVLASALGTSNWDAPAITMVPLSPAERIERIAKGIFGMTAFAVIAVLLARGFKRKAPKSP